MAEERLDTLLVRRGLAPSRARAQEMIAAGQVRAGGDAAAKASRKYPLDTDISVTGGGFPWVGRGAVKLDFALRHFALDVAGAVCLDLGASTGGFTEVLLHNGAARVYAVDVGHGQLHEKLENDARVVNLEGLHAKDMTAAHIPDAVDVIVADVSFISLAKVLPYAFARAADAAVLVALVKPQFEAGRENIARGGIVRDDAVREKCLQDVADFVNAQEYWHVSGTARSPIEGGDGNVEFLLCARKSKG